jgi:hypothetical protein
VFAIRIVALWVLLVSFIPGPALAAPPAPYAFGEVVKSHGLAIQVVRWVYVILEPGVLATGQQAMGVDVLVSNLGDTALYSPFQFLTLRDSGNRRYDPDPKIHVEGDLSTGAFPMLNPGEQARRWMVFLPAINEPGPFTLAFNAEFMFGLAAQVQPKEWLFDLGSQPAAVPQSPELLGPTASAHQAGELIQSGGLAVAVLGWTAVPDQATGTQLARVEVEIANQGQTAREVDAPSLTDANGSGYHFSPPRQMDGRDPLLRTVIVPGERMHAVVDFITPATVGGLTFGFGHHCSPSGQGCESDRVLVALPAQPRTLSLPAGFPTDQIPVHGMNDPVRAGSLLLTVTDARLTDQSFVVPQVEGRTYLVADVTLQNTGVDVVKWSLADQMRVKDAQDRYYVPGVWAVRRWPNDEFGMEIGPGQTVNGHLGFQLPPDPTKLILVFQTVDAQNNPLKVDVALAPTAVAAKPRTPSVVTPPPTPSVQAPAPTKILATHPVGELIAQADITLQVLKWSRPPAGGALVAVPGKTIVRVDVSLKNTGQSQLFMAPDTAMTLRDAAGRSYDNDLRLAAMSAQGQPPPFTFPIEPGSVRSGAVWFQIPPDAQGLVFVLDASQLHRASGSSSQGENVSVVLGAQPTP